MPARIGDKPLTAAEKSARYRAAHLVERQAADRVAAKSARERDPAKFAARHKAWREKDLDFARRLTREAGKKWRASNPDAHRDANLRWKEANPGIVRATVIRRQFGISPLQLAAAIYFQGGRCAICRCMLEGGRKQHVDHDHRTGAFRGVLCSGCNTAIGTLGDDPVVLARAASYVRNGGRL